MSDLSQLPVDYIAYLEWRVTELEVALEDLCGFAPPPTFAEWQAAQADKPVIQPELPRA